MMQVVFKTRPRISARSWLGFGLLALLLAACGGDGSPHNGGSDGDTTYTLTVTLGGSGGGTVTGQGVSCGTDCTETYPEGTQVTLSAQANPDSLLINWSNCDTPSGNQCTLTINGDKQVGATFQLGSGGGGDVEGLEVTVQNEGSQTARVGHPDFENRQFSTCLLLDENNLPLEWNFLDREEGWEGSLAPGEAGRTLTDTAVHLYDGSASKILVRVDFEAEGSPDTSVPGDISGNNAAVLSGGVIGGGSAEASALRREITVNLENPNLDFELGTAYATRSSADSEYGSYIIPMTNSSGAARCFTRLSELTYKDVSGTTLEEQSFDFLTGSVGTFPGSAIYTDTCLGAQETGYVFGIVSDLYTQLSEIEIGAVEAQADGISGTTLQVIPQSYRVGASPGLLSVNGEKQAAWARLEDFKLRISRERSTLENAKLQLLQQTKE